MNKKGFGLSLADHGLAVLPMSVNLEFVVLANEGERSSHSDLPG